MLFACYRYISRERGDMYQNSEWPLSRTAEAANRYARHGTTSHRICRGCHGYQDHDQEQEQTYTSAVRRIHNALINLIMFCLGGFLSRDIFLGHRYEELSSYRRDVINRSTTFNERRILQAWDKESASYSGQWYTLLAHPNFRAVFIVCVGVGVALLSGCYEYRAIAVPSN